MDNNGKGILGDPNATGEQIRQAWEFAALEAMKVHMKTGEPVVTWDRETKSVLLVPPEMYVASEQAALGKGSAGDVP